MSIRVRNWRDQAPYVGHISALVWTLYQSHDKDETSPPEINRLHGINSFVKHGLQGHQHSDYHRHDSIEQLYFVLRGRGQLLIGDDKVDVRDGTAVYMPVNVPHQAFNDGEGWMEHLIVSCPLDEIREGTPAVRDWRDVHPVVREDGTVSWPLLRREEEAPAGEGGVLQRVHSVTRYAVQGRRGTDWQQSDGIELVHYVLSGFGVIEDGEENRQLVTEGSAVHVLPGVAHRFANQGEGWLEFVTFAVEVGEVEAPDQADEDEASEVTDVQYGVEEAAAVAVVAEVDWDEADAVETEEEIEEDEGADAVDEDEDEAEAEDGAEVEDEAEAEIEVEAADGADDEDDSGDIEGEVVVVEEEAGEDTEEGEAGEVDEAEAEVEEEAVESVEDDVDDETDAGEIEDTVAEVEGDVAEEGEDGEDVVEEDAIEEAVDGTEEVEDEADEAVIAEVDLVEDDEEGDEGEGDEADNAESSGDDDEIDLEDDDADFDIEEEDETSVEDDAGEEEDDSPAAYRR